MAEEATGLSQGPRGIGSMYFEGGQEITVEEAGRRIRDGENIEVPNAGAGSYRAFFESVGFTQVEVFQNSSSAGDWVFVVRDGPEGEFYPAFQTNRYPRYGFGYSVDCNVGYSSFEEFCKTQNPGS